MKDAKQDLIFQVSYLPNDSKNDQENTNEANDPDYLIGSSARHHNNPLLTAFQNTKLDKSPLSFSVDVDGDTLENIRSDSIDEVQKLVDEGMKLHSHSI